MRELSPFYRKPLHRSRFSWLRSSQTLKAKHKLDIELLSKVAQQTARAWAIRQYAMQLWDYKSRYWAEQVSMAIYFNPPLAIKIDPPSGV